jgi:hypothetical protein
LWLLVATTGLRRGELAGLTRNDADPKARRIHPSTPRVVVAGRAVESEAKTRSGVRTLALDPDTCNALEDYLVIWAEEGYLLGQDRRLLFVWPNGDPLHPDTVTAQFHKHCEAAGLPRIRLHDVRHSYATAALKAGISPKVISERLRHSSAAFTLQTYTHVIPGMDEAAADTVAKLILAEPVTEPDTDGTILGTIEPEAESEKTKNPLTLSVSAGQRVLPLVAGAGFEPATSGQDRRPVPDYVRTWVPLGNLGLLRRFSTGRRPDYRNVSGRLPIVSDDVLMTCRIPSRRVGPAR